VFGKWELAASISALRIAILNFNNKDAWEFKVWQAAPRGFWSVSRQTNTDYGPDRISMWQGVVAILNN
jgi:hypothetical protein